MTSAPTPDPRATPAPLVTPAPLAAVIARLSPGRAGLFHDREEFSVLFHAKSFVIMELALGLLTVAWPLAWAPGWPDAVAVLGGAAVLAAALGGWRRGPVLATAAAVVVCAASRAGTAVLAAEGLFILGYLLAADAPPGLTRPGSWLRQQAFGVLAGLIASGAVLAALSLRQVSSAWLTGAGLAAAACAYLIALPLARPGRRGSDVDVQ
jgi:hypothetical protein